MRSRPLTARPAALGFQPWAPTSPIAQPTGRRKSAPRSQNWLPANGAPALFWLREEQGAGCKTRNEPTSSTRPTAAGGGMPRPLASPLPRRLARPLAQASACASASTTTTPLRQSAHHPPAPGLANHLRHGARLPSLPPAPPRRPVRAWFAEDGGAKARGSYLGAERNQIMSWGRQKKVSGAAGLRGTGSGAQRSAYPLRMCCAPPPPLPPLPAAGLCGGSRVAAPPHASMIIAFFSSAPTVSEGSAPTAAGRRGGTSVSHAGRPPGAKPSAASRLPRRSRRASRPRQPARAVRSRPDCCCNAPPLAAHRTATS